MIQALTITSEVVQNSFHRAVIVEGIATVKRGGLLSEVFAKNEKLFPALVGEMIAVGEETGALSDMLVRVADFYEEEVSQKTKNMTTIIEPFLMLIVGGAVGFFAYAMVGPIYSLSNAI
jgi:type IV pilus assembly protein PilC